MHTRYAYAQERLPARPERNRLPRQGRAVRLVSVQPGYDPFERGRFPAGVTTAEVRDAGRDRLFPYEIWYPATDRHAGQDTAPGAGDTFDLAAGGSRRQAAVRGAAARPGRYPLVV